MVASTDPSFSDLVPGLRVALDPRSRSPAWERPQLTASPDHPTFKSATLYKVPDTHPEILEFDRRDSSRTRDKVDMIHRYLQPGADYTVFSYFIRRVENSQPSCFMHPASAMDMFCFGILKHAAQHVSSYCKAFVPGKSRSYGREFTDFLPHPSHFLPTDAKHKQRNRKT